MRILLLALAAGALVVLAWRFRPAARNHATSTSTHPDLRGRVLRREFLAGVAPSTDGRPRAVVMDWSMDKGTATLVAYDDGTTSLYTSTGGGVIGAGSHEEVRDAAEAFQAEAERTLKQFAAVASTDPLPLPPPNAVSFYVITDSATLRAGPIATSRLIADEHPLAALGNKAQAVIAAIHQSAP